MLWEPPTHIYAGPIRRGIAGQHLVPYGLKHRYYATTRGMGQAGGGSCFDKNDIPVDCLSPSCAYQNVGDMNAICPVNTDPTQGCFDSSNNRVDCSSPHCAYQSLNGLETVCPQPPAPPGPPPSGQPGGGTTPTPVSGPAGVPTGSILRYEGNWQTTSGGQGMSVNEIITAVSQALPQYGLQVVSSQNDYSGILDVILKIGVNFNVQLILQVTGAGYARPQDAGQNIDHAYYTVTGKMPVFSNTVVQSLGTSTPESLFRPGGGTKPGSTGMTMSQWFQQNAGTIGLLLVALVAVPAVVKKL